MRILIIGANGMAGSELVKAALADGHSVIGNGRSAEKLLAIQKDNPKMEMMVKDAFNLDPTDIRDVDVILDAFAVAPDQAYLHVDLAAKLIAMTRNSKKRVGFVLGAGSLLTGSDRHHAYDDIAADPANVNWQSIPENQLYELEFLKHVKNVNWFGASPGLVFVPGPKADHIIYGQDGLLFNDQGQSETTAGTMAYAIINELKEKKHERERFTVING